MAVANSTIQANINSQITSMTPSIQTAQNNYYTAHGVYGGARWSHSVPPDGGIQTAPDQAANWMSPLGITLPALMYASMNCVNYGQGASQGYFLTARYTNGGPTWQKTVNLQGTMTDISQDWQQIA